MEDFAKGLTILQSAGYIDLDTAKAVTKEYLIKEEWISKAHLEELEEQKAEAAEIAKGT